MKLDSVTNEICSLVPRDIESQANILLAKNKVPVDIV